MILCMCKAVFEFLIKVILTILYPILGLIGSILFLGIVCILAVGLLLVLVLVLLIGIVSAMVFPWIKN